MYAWLWRRLPGGRRARAAQLCAAAAVVVVVCFGWVFPAVSTLLDSNGATVGSAPHPGDRADPVMTPAGEAS